MNNLLKSYDFVKCSLKKVAWKITVKNKSFWKN